MRFPRVPDRDILFPASNGVWWSAPFWLADPAGRRMIAVLQVLEATEGGTRRHLRDLVGALDPGGFRVALCVSCGRDPGFRDDVAGYVASGLRVEEVPMRRGIAPFADLASLIRLVRCVRRVRPDVIHAHSAKAGFLSRVAGVLCRVPVVYTPHAFPFLMTRGKKAPRFYRFLERCARDATAALIAVSGEERREAFALGYERGRVHYIPNGVAPRGGREVTVREGGVLKVGFFGRLTPQKGPDVLMDTVADVAAHVPHVSFVFYGEGELGALLRARVEERLLAAHVQFNGAYAPGEAVACMRQVDVVAIPSRWEGCPYVVLEAFQAGVPVVASAVGGMPDLIRDGVSGVLVEAENTEALCDGLLGLLRDPQKRRRLAEQGRAAVEAHTAAGMAGAVGAVYRSVARVRECEKKNAPSV